MRMPNLHGEGPTINRTTARAEELLQISWRNLRQEIIDTGDQRLLVTLADFGVAVTRWSKSRPARFTPPD